MSETPRQITDSRAIYLSMFDGWIVQIKTARSGRHWYTPMEETTYGVLDSEQYNVYPTEEAAVARMNEIVSS